MGIAGEIALQASHQFFGQRSRDIFSTGECLSRRKDEFGRGAFLGQVADGTQLENANGEAVLRIGANYQDARLRGTELDLLQQIKTAPARQVNIEKNEVPGSLVDEEESLAGVAGLLDGEAAEILTQDLGKTAANDFMIIYDKYAHWLVASSKSAAKGM